MKPLPDNVLDVEDDFGNTVRQYRDTLRSLNDEADERIRKRIRYMTSNYLFAYGVPQTPGDVLYFAESLGTSLAAALVLDDLVDIKDEARRDEADIKDEDEPEVKPQTIFDFLKTEVERPYGATEGHLGGYL